MALNRPAVTVGDFDYAAQLLVVIAIWGVQLIVRPIWLQNFRFGPASCCGAR